jgi:hypothetical protein
MIMTKTYTIRNSNGLSGTRWTCEYASREAAADEIRMAYGWDQVVLSGGYSIDDAPGTAAYSAYATQDDCGRDPDGGHAPQVIEARS